MNQFINVNGIGYTIHVKPRLDDNLKSFLVIIENEHQRVTFFYLLENMQLVNSPQDKERSNISNDLFEALNTEVIKHVKANWSPWQK